MNHALLDHHDAIAWDMDGTLIDGPNASVFRRYIKANQHKRHLIVTFRDPHWAQEVYSELFPYGVLEHHIHGVSACPQEFYRAYTDARFDAAEWVRHAPKSYDEARALCRGPLRNFEHANAYLHWKGEEAKRLGCTVLVDDMEHLVIAGCTKHGVAFVDAFDERFGRPDLKRGWIDDDQL